MLTGLQQALFRAGYVVSPNNIFGVEGCIMYPAGPGVRCPQNQRLVWIQATETTIRVLGYPLTNTTNKPPELVTFGEFHDIESYLAWCSEISEPGQPACEGNWD